MQKAISYDDEVRLEDLFDKYTKQKKACLSEVQRQESLLDFVGTFRDDDKFETLEQFEEAVLHGDAWDFKCNTSAPEDPRPEAERQDAERCRNGQEAQPNGYYFKTTFWQDFTTAERFGVPAVQDTFNRAFREWRSNCIYLTEFVLVLNWKIWTWYNTEQKLTGKAAEEKAEIARLEQLADAEQDPQKKLEHIKAAELHKKEAEAAEKNAAFCDTVSRLYNKFWQEADDFARDNLKGKELSYFYEVTD